MSRVVVSGALASKPMNGGNAWTRLSWVLGFKQLGFDVTFVEEISSAACVDRTGHPIGFEESSNLMFFQEVVDQFKLEGSAALVCDDGQRTWGMSRSEVDDVAEEADLLFNMSGHLHGSLRRRFRRSAFFDDDPGFTQFWWAQRNAGARLEGHQYWFTIGENLGLESCSIPTGGIPWRTTRVPVTLGEWPVAAAKERARFTTVATWRGPYGPVHYGGHAYGLKVHEFRKFMDLPARVPLQFELALDIGAAEVDDLEALHRNGWKLVDPHRVARGPLEFQRYIQSSGAEFSVAQGVYVATGSGWFSDRSIRYLASGKPVLVQDTGFSRNYPVGEGLVAFSTPDQAVAGAERITADYDRHASAARALAEEYFDARVVVAKVCEEVGIAP
jgi:hypothetical protein